MKASFLLLMITSTMVFGQNKNRISDSEYSPSQFVQSINTLMSETALELANRIRKNASAMEKSVSIAILDASGTTVMLLRGNGVGPHNTEASRRKAYTALSTKTPTLLLMRNAEKILIPKT